ncbi:hypothetical protein T492DRAFT_956505 [Pavlovales sp. CCMP2436]|nr:hypothetical protein T492DRAFT_956505 [Pavlovales sp. CCMP2436]
MEFGGVREATRASDAAAQGTPPAARPTPAISALARGGGGKLAFDEFAAIPYMLLAKPARQASE